MNRSRIDPLVISELFKGDGDYKSFYFENISIQLVSTSKRNCIIYYSSSMFIHLIIHIYIYKHTRLISFPFIMKKKKIIIIRLDYITFKSKIN